MGWKVLEMRLTDRPAALGRLPEAWLRRWSLVLVQELIDDRENRRSIDWFSNESASTDVATSASQFLGSDGGGQEDDRDPVRVGVGAELSGYLRTGHPRHHKVKQDQVWLESADGEECVGPGVGGADFVIAVMLDGEFQESSDTAFVVGDQDSFGFHGCGS